MALKIIYKAFYLPEGLMVEKCLNGKKITT